MRGTLQLDHHNASQLQYPHQDLLFDDDYRHLNKCGESLQNDAAVDEKSLAHVLRSRTFQQIGAGAGKAEAADASGDAATVQALLQQHADATLDPSGPSKAFVQVFPLILIPKTAPAV